jgi:hypothetical protein
MFDHEASVNMPMHEASGDGEFTHGMTECVGLLVFAEEPQVGVDQGIDKQAVADHPLFITPIAGRQLAGKHVVGWALVVHPGKGFIDGCLEEVVFMQDLPEDAGSQQKQGRGITGTTIILVMDERWECGRVWIGFPRGFPAPCECWRAVFYFP